MKDTTPISEIVAQVGSRFIQLSDEIWANPQLRWQEHASVEKQIEVAVEFGFHIERNVAGIPTAFSAEKGESGPLIAILGEFDALAGLSQEAGATEPLPNSDTDNPNGHGCGHNLLGSGSLLAAVAAARYLEVNALPGRVRYYGCPAEEAAAGKTFMVKGGAFEGIDAAVSWHPGSVMSTRQVLSLAYTQVHFRFTGLPLTRAQHRTLVGAHSTPLNC